MKKNGEYTATAEIMVKCFSLFYFCFCSYALNQSSTDACLSLNVLGYALKARGKGSRPLYTHQIHSRVAHLFPPA
jgi:hypothetical protein